MPAYGIAMMLYAYDLTAFKEAPRLLAVVFFNSFVMPVIAIATMKGIGFIESFEMRDSKERIIPFIAAMVFYLWTFLAVKSSFNLGGYFNMFILGAVISLMVSFFINLFHKLSIHMVGASGLLMALILTAITAVKPVLPLILGVMLLNGLIASARLYLKAHTNREIYTGFLVGIFGQMIALNLYKFLS